MSTIQSVQRACALLFALEEAYGPMSTAELAHAVRLDRAVVHRLLRTLQADGLVEGDGGRFSLGGHLLTLANAYVDRLAVRHAALPYAVDLSVTACAGQPWVVYLAIPVGGRAVTIERIWSREAPLDTILSLGTAFPLDHSAAGRSMMAFWPHEARVALLGQARADALAPRFQEIRADGGVELNRGEHEPGISGIAAAIVTNDGRSVASLIVSGLHLEGHLDRRSPLALKIRRAAQSIGQGLAVAPHRGASTRRERAS